ncbi:MAG: lysophospholipid acyltransferase family protein [Chloroflexi bacterium]|nr:lysophospholipid acyltransferase family protein [Chloroflexota bacterium]
MSAPERPRAPRLPGPIRAALRLAAALPLPAGYWLVAALGELAVRLDPNRARQTIDTLAVVLAQTPAHPAARRLARAACRADAMRRLDDLRLPALPPALVERGLLLQGWAQLDAALERGRGVVAVTATVGGWNLIAAVLARRGYRVAAAADLAAPAALAALARNEVVVAIVDGPPATDGVPVRFFGRPTTLPSGPARLALTSGAPLLHIWLLRRLDLISFQGGVEPVVDGDPAADVQVLSQALADRLERLIQAHPEQWTMARSPWLTAD